MKTQTVHFKTPVHDLAMPDIAYTTIKKMSLFESLVSLCIKSVNIVVFYSFSLLWISLCD